MNTNDCPKMYSKISVKQRNNMHFAVTVTNAFTDEINTMDVHTNIAGEGLWIGGKQTLGTCQFSAGKNPREAIRRFFQQY